MNTPLTDEIDRLRKINAELVSALERVWDAYGWDPSIDSSIWQEVRNALTKAKEG